MEGLEISEVNYKEILSSNKYFRIDEEFFSKKNTALYNTITNKNYKKLIELSHLITDFGAFSQMNFVNYYDDGIPFLRNQNIKDNFIDISDSVFIDNNTYTKLSLKLGKNDILLPRAGTIGKAAVVTDEILPATANQNLAQIKPNIELINPYFLSTFICSKFGEFQIIRNSTGNVQQWLNLENINNLAIYTADFQFQKKIEVLIIDAHSRRKISLQKYTEAENLLLKTLSLKNFQPATEAVNVKSFKESFAITGRLDAEYYQPKYEQIVGRIKQNDWKLLNQIVDISKSIEPGSSAYDEERGLPFYRVSDYSKFGLNTPTKNLSFSYVKENKALLNDLKPKTGTILLSKDGSVGTAYLLTEDLNGITSGATLHLKLKKNLELLPEYLTLVLNSKLVQMQSERDAGGSIILHWRINEIENVVVPILNFFIQQQIAALIQESFVLKAESEKLLEVAKRAVEIAIEESEEIAMSYINENSI